MGRSTTSRTTLKNIRIPMPAVPTVAGQLQLPYQGTVVPERGFSFSFTAFDRTHELFNLGDNSEQLGVISGKWFVDLLDCLKNVSKMTVIEMKASMYDLHPVDWDKANTSIPTGSSQCEYWQFRINKSKGRVIGVLTDGVFYNVWLDPHHNLSNSEGYGTEQWHKAPRGLYETQELKVAQLEAENRRLTEDLNAAENLIKEFLGSPRRKQSGDSSILPTLGKKVPKPTHLGRLL